MDDSLLNFSVSLYGDLIPYDSTKSIARCRIFYRALNRNGTYITNTFAEKLIKSLPYTPIKGIYSPEKADYEDHGIRRDLGRIYAIVPENHNFAWERHLDEDGIERTYACCDVLVYTALYEEAKSIVGKSLSMELYKNATTGSWQKINGKECYVFEDGCFLGLQILGDAVEPCFEGASFYSLKNTFQSFLEDIQEYDLKNKQNAGGQDTMPGLNFKNTDANYAAIFSAVNTQYNEENEYAITYTVIRYDDECVFAYNHETNTFENIKYTKDEEGNFTLGEKETVYVLNLTESENAAIASLKETNGNTFENIVENFGLKSDFEQKKLESEETISTLTTERDNSIAEYTKLQGEFEDLKTKYQKLEEANTSYENEKKNELLTKYSVKLDSEVIEKYRNDLSNYTYTDLDKNLAYELVKADDSIFSLNNGEGQAIPKADEPLSGIEAALSKYSN